MCGGSISFPLPFWFYSEFYGVCGDGRELHWRECSSTLSLLLPTLGFLNQYFFIYSFVSDHWQYLACLGIITPCASGIVLLAGRFKRWQGWLEPGVTLVIAGRAVRCLPRSKAGCTADNETLYRTAIARNPGCWMAQVNLGNMLYKANRIPEAMDLFKQASEIKPAVAHYSLGNAFIEKGRTSEAIDEYQAGVAGSILITRRRTITWAAPYC